MKNRLFIYCITILSLASTGVFAQTGTGLKSNIATINAMWEKQPVEKLYLQLDKPYYSLGDTLRFKAYLLNANFLTPATRSGLLYVELDNANGVCIKRIMTAASLGLAWCDIVLDEKQIPQGSYTLRAYTNWMRNFGDDYIFKKSIYISALNNSTLITSAFKLDSAAGKNNIQAGLHFSGLYKNNLGFKDFKLLVLNVKHTLLRDKVTTGIDGSVNITFSLADKTVLKNLGIKAQQTGQGADTAQLHIPVTINRTENTDLQFMPEGGNLIAGIKTKVGFKAIGEDGKSLYVTGKVYNSKQQQVTAFTSVYKGMGSFELTPQAGEHYTATLAFANGTTKTYALPTVNNAGTALAIRSTYTDSLVISVSSANAPGTYYLISQARSVVCYAQSINFGGSNALTKTIAATLFPTGIARFTLLNANRQPVNERQVFINHNDGLQININPDKPSYATRDSVNLAIEIKDKEGKPVQGSFSLAVTDDDQVKTDSLGSNILTNLLLTSDLKGDIETPAYYFSSPNKTTELDNLLLTQGWVGYDWGKIFTLVTPPAVYPAEPEFLVQGRVSNLFNKAIEKSSVTLIAKTPATFRDTETDKDGIFTFKGLFPVDTALVKLTAHNKKSQSSGIGIDIINAFKPPVFKAPAVTPAPWYVNTDSTLLNNTHTKLKQQKAETTLRGEGNLLHEVKITEKKKVKNSRHLIEPNPYDQVLDEEDMLKANKQTLSDILATKIKGFQIKSPATSYLINFRPIYFVIDGISLNQQFTGVNKQHVDISGNPFGPTEDPGRYNFLRSYMDFFTAEDILGIEVMSGVASDATYTSRYIPVNQAWKPIYGPSGFVFVEITTRSGQGPFIKPTPGTYMYKPIPFTVAKQFYSPKYTAKNKAISPGTDLRSTIHWEPEIVTKADGKAHVSFYCADNAANYTLLIEGTDLNGQIGYSRKKIKVVKGAAN